MLEVRNIEVKIYAEKGASFFFLFFYPPASKIKPGASHAGLIMSS